MRRTCAGRNRRLRRLKQWNEKGLKLFDAVAIGEALECEPQSRGANVVEFNLTNDLLGIRAKLAVIEPRRGVSLYLRGRQAFLGFIHINRIERVSIDKRKGEVTFIGEGDVTSQLSVQRGGVFLVTRHEP